jgi:hypothetical protein
MVEIWGYHASSWYFPAFDISITVFNNDNSKSSWDLLPVVRELLRTYLANVAVGLEDLAVDGFSYGPNPFTNELTITLEKEFGEGLKEVQLVNSLGQKVASQVEIITNQEEMVVNFYDLEPLPTGIYFVQLVGENGSRKSIQVVK